MAPGGDACLTHSLAQFAQDARGHFFHCSGDRRGQAVSDRRPADLNSIHQRDGREPAERALYESLKTASAQATRLFQQGDFTGYLRTFAVLKAPVDAFFDSVMVMAEDPALRRSRLALLADLRAEMNRIADLSKLAA